MLNTIEAIFLVSTGTWGILYCNGRLSYSGDKEERRLKRVEKYGWLLVICSVLMFISGLGLLVLTYS